MIENLYKAFPEFNWEELPHIGNINWTHLKGWTDEDWISIIDKDGSGFEVWSSFHENDPTHHQTIDDVVYYLKRIMKSVPRIYS